MTGLGAAIYGGFFGLAALWLYLTSDAVAGRRERARFYDQEPVRSNSDSVAAHSGESSPVLVSHSSSK
jgi:hypothetical protein